MDWFSLYFDYFFNFVDARRIVTRSKTGSLTPKQFTDSVTSTTASVKTRSSDDVLVINKDGDITRVTRSKSALMMQQSVYYKLGKMITRH